MSHLAQRLIAEERRATSDSDRGGRAGFRVCEKLRRPLSTFAGAAGYHSLLSRALVLAKAQEPLLKNLRIKTDGTLEHSPEWEAQRESVAAAKAMDALVTQLLGLLITFIGEALTLRLIHDVWPEAALEDPKSEQK